MNLGVALLCACLAVPEPSPPLRDLKHFPCSWVTAENVRFADLHLDWLDKRLAWDLVHEWELSTWQWEAKELRACWQALSRAQDAALGQYGEDQRREALVELRWRLGDVAYAQGRMPPCVPQHRFGR